MKKASDGLPRRREPLKDIQSRRVAGQYDTLRDESIQQRVLLDKVKEANRRKRQETEFKEWHAAIGYKEFRDKNCYHFCCPGSAGWQVLRLTSRRIETICFPCLPPLRPS